MTHREFLKSEFLKNIAPDLEKLNFRLNKSLCTAYRRNEEGWLGFSLIFLINEQEGWTLNTSIGIRKDVVESIYHKTSGFETKYQKNTATIGCFIEDYIQQYDNIRINLIHESQIINAKDLVINLFDEIGLSYFQNYADIKTIDDLLNYNPLEECVHSNTIFRGAKGIITAKLTERGNYTELVEIYRKHYTEFCNGFYLPSYVELVNYLEKYG